MNCLCAHEQVVFVFIAKNGEINTKITAGWALKQFIMTVHTFLNFVYDMLNP